MKKLLVLIFLVCLSSAGFSQVKDKTKTKTENDGTKTKTKHEGPIHHVTHRKHITHKKHIRRKHIIHHKKYKRVSKNGKTKTKTKD